MFRNIFKKKKKEEQVVENNKKTKNNEKTKKDNTTNSNDKKFDIKNKYMCHECKKDLNNSPKSKLVDDNTFFICCDHCGYVNTIKDDVLVPTKNTLKTMKLSYNAFKDNGLVFNSFKIGSIDDTYKISELLESKSISKFTNQTINKITNSNDNCKVVNLADYRKKI